MFDQSCNWPDFFIVGAPKSGTTALCEYLKQHPDIFIPRVKEPHYFGNDLRFSTPRISTSDYHKLFQSAGSGQLCGEGSVMYLLSATAAEEIKTQCPQAKIIIMLRNPVDLLYSLHSQMLYSGNEYIADFEQALAAEDDRRLGKRMPKLVRRYDLLRYREVVRFRPQIARYIETFDWQNVLIILYRNFKEDTAVQYTRALSFLGVDPAYHPEYRVVNANKTVRSATLRNLQRCILQSSRLRSITTGLLPRGVRQAGLRLIRAVNTKQTSRPPLSRGLRCRLQKHYAPDIDALGDWLHLDLSHWHENG